MATKNHKVDVLIKARDQASKQFGMIGQSAMGMTSMLKKAAAAAAVFFGGRALYRFGKDAVVAAAEQEKADALLAQSLANVGANVAALFPALKAYAGELQKDTLYGDEFNEQLMSLGLNLGISTDKIKEATKGAIGLSAATGGKMGLQDSMKNLALAHKGEFTMLNRYIPALRAAKTVTEKTAILQKTLADGYELAKKEAQKGLGPIIQMKNAMGDVKEAIGLALLPTVQRSATAIRLWAEGNQQKIGAFAQKSVSYLELAKDSFMSFAGFMKSDWMGSMAWVFDSFLSLLRTAFGSAIKLAVAGGKGVYQGVSLGLKGKFGENAEVERRYTAAGGKYKHTGFLTREATDPQKEAQIRKEVEPEFAQKEQKATESIIGPAFASVIDTWKDVAKAIKDDMPKKFGDEVDKAFANHLQRLVNIGKQGIPATSQYAGVGQDTGDGSGDEDLTKKKKLAGGGGGGGPGSLRAIEARLLTNVKGSYANTSAYLADMAAKKAGDRWNGDRRDLVGMGGDGDPSFVGPQQQQQRQTGQMVTLLTKVVTGLERLISVTNPKSTGMPGVQLLPSAM